MKKKTFDFGKPGDSITYWMSGESAKLLFVIKFWKIYIEVYKKLS